AMSPALLRRLDRHQPDRGAPLPEQVEPRRALGPPILFQQIGMGEIGIIVRMPVVTDAEPSLGFAQFHAADGVKICPVSSFGNFYKLICPDASSERLTPPSPHPPWWQCLRRALRLAQQARLLPSLPLEG